MRPSRFARRFTLDTPFAVGSPAAGHPMMRTAADPAGRTVLGTLNNCASSRTPWGTYLSGEENWAFYFGGSKNLDAHQKRWGLRDKSFYAWEGSDARFDVQKTPNEPNRFGWIVEVDPMDPDSTPIKRTALGRAAHEGAWVALTRDQRAVVYSGEDARFEYIYKFVSRDRMQPGGAKANRELLDHGTLYVARFDQDNTGRWLELTHGKNGLTAANGFASQADICIHTRRAADLVGATKMDRPEWIAAHPHKPYEIYCTLTNNSERGKEGKPGVDAANPRVDNSFGQIIRWFEGDNNPATTEFVWDLFALGGSPTGTDAIRVALIHKPAKVTPQGSAMADTDPVHNRPPLAQAFSTPNGERLTVVVNHFKSKGCTDASGANADQGEGDQNEFRLIVDYPLSIL